MYQNDAQKCLTGEVRLSYAHLYTPRQPRDARGNPTGDAKYTVTLLIPKADTATKADLDAAFNAAATAAVSTKRGGVRPPQLDALIHDGDGVRQDGTPYGPECKGHWVLTASGKNKPQCVGIDNISCELDPRDVYSGMYARVTVRFSGYNTGSNKGVGCGLGNVLKIRDGEPLSGGANASSDFAGIGNVGGMATPNAGVRYDPITGQPLA